MKDKDICWECGIGARVFQDPDGLCMECRKALNASWAKMDEMHNDQLREHHGY
jgi:hypothetical protein